MFGRYTYAFGYKTHAEADDKIDDLLAAGEVSSGELPMAQAYRNADGVKRWRITLLIA